MNVFVTGASGFVGSAVVKELVRAGHRPIGLVRSEGSARRLIADGGEAHFGDLTDARSLRAGVEKAQGVIHTGFIHDFSRFQACCEHDRAVIRTIGETLRGTSHPFVITSALGILPTETTVVESTLASTSHPRVATEEAFQHVVGLGVNASLVRLPPTVHGLGDHGFVPTLIKIAKLKGVSAYVGDGQNTWPAVHRFDAARLFVKALGRVRAGAHYHAVAEEGVPFKDIAGAIARGLNLEAKSLTPEEARAHFADFATFAHFVVMNLRASSEKTRRELEWTPTDLGLLEDLAQPGYFAG